jgi:hypothetical protein
VNAMVNHQFPTAGKALLAYGTLKLPWTLRGKDKTISYWFYMVTRQINNTCVTKLRSVNKAAIQWENNLTILLLLFFHDSTSENFLGEFGKWFGYKASKIPIIPWVRVCSFCQCKISQSPTISKTHAVHKAFKLIPTFKKKRQNIKIEQFGAGSALQDHFTCKGHYRTITDHNACP